ncbi:hypothetical protein KUF71_001500 [Frankliniella fusca]|uniref:Uncharacterized protein n=1 Tax=Frankliniella fusca TaxID=407009 RepID=A0AAE1HJY6_9NEOP|nr:hypothetical protein KUF71_001500 [Frankliniella fusca]
MAQGDPIQPQPMAASRASDLEGLTETGHRAGHQEGLFPKKHSGSSRGAVGSTSRTDWPVGQILKTIYQREEEKSAN